MAVTAPESVTGCRPGCCKWRLGVQVVAIDPSAAFRKALRMWLPRTAVAVDAFHLVKLANDALTQVRQRLTQETKGRRRRSGDPVWANRHLLMCGANSHSARAWDSLQTVFAVDDPTGRLEAAWHVKEQVRSLLHAGSLADAAVERQALREAVQSAAQSETSRL